MCCGLLWSAPFCSGSRIPRFGLLSSVLVCSCAECLIVSQGEHKYGWKSKVQRRVVNVAPNEMLADAHRKMAEPGIGKQNK
jgi:hypothetical protein